ncbi:3-deoxy-D-manno-octulosonate 8-phosphate phosphatase (KDO 8-P phosphatase) [Desulfobaculum xiamenense]|uniref:3-deoxy-D-manno-octulosonate 8-phosphate phosphatase (KDO 8-P phosphatase) n=1 Tax=Desulfobaculum xiamenense TaxID=995050 RepID=A0A846QPT3_9BACT|nr:HAD hydrolase family protein [Desulfobaculum xiamenense]NJB66709.1 3-deoxy-D-manno-octulosonate 8-phosphate phosphatase (KDO 8-P phosphatase) [Desulfobaculum xiamenense]
MSASEAAIAAARQVRVLVLDVDGVLTDGGLYYDAAGDVSKRFNVQDGLGIKLAQAAGLVVAVITGLKSKAVEKRVRELGIKDYHAGHTAKIPLLQQICDAHGVQMSQVAYLGDDWVDAGPLRSVGLPMAVCNAQPEIRDMAAWVSTVPGGHGAVRECIRFILEAQDKLGILWEEWKIR